MQRVVVKSLILSDASKLPFYKTKKEISIVKYLMVEQLSLC